MNVVQLLDERWDSALTEYGLSLAEALKARGHRSFVFAREDRHAYAEARKRGLDVRPLKGPVDFRRAVKRLGAEVVNAHTGSGHFLAWTGAAGRRIALIRTRGDARPLARRAGHAWLYGRTDAVVAASRFIAGQYRALYPGVEGRLWTVYPGVRLEAFSPEPPGPIRVALLGRLDPVKGQSDFLEAVHHVRGHLGDEKFIVAGEAKNTPEEELRRQAERLHVSRWVEFAGRLPDVAAFMRGCHVGVIASVGSEALSRAGIEWMSAGRPVVAAAVGCLPELISSGENGLLVPPRSPAALGTCLLGLLKDAALRREMGRRAHELASARFGFETFAVETEKAYEAALRRRWGRA